MNPRSTRVSFLAVLIAVVLAIRQGWLDWLHDAGWVTAVGTGVLATAALATFLVVYKTANLAVSSLDDARKTRHGELITDLSRRWDEPQIIQSQTAYAETTRDGVEELVTKLYDSTTPEAATPRELAKFFALEAVPNLVETIGVLEDLGAIDLAVVDALWGDAIRGSWSQWQPAVEAMRELTGRPSIYRYFQQVAERL